MTTMAGARPHDTSHLWDDTAHAVYAEMKQHAHRDDWPAFRAAQDRLIAHQNVLARQHEQRTGTRIAVRDGSLDADRRSLLDRVRHRIVEAYALRWDELTPGLTNDGRPCLQRFSRDVLDDWLAGDAFLGTPILVNHGQQPDSTSRSLVLDEPVGDLVYARADDVGLRSWALYRDTPLADQALDAMRDGALTAYSVRALVSRSRPTGETVDGLPVYELQRATIAECGPTHQPADPGALVLRVGGVDVEHRDRGYAPTYRRPRAAEDDIDAIAAMTPAEIAATVLGFVGIERTVELSDEFEQAHRRRERDAAERAERIGRALTALKTARNRVEFLYGCWRDGLATRAEFDAAEAEADQHDTWLREHLFADQYTALLRERGIPPKRTPMQRMRADLNAVRRRW